MTAEQQTVLALVRSQITNESPCLPCDVTDWSAVLAEARQQAVLPAVFEALSKLGSQVPQSVLNECFEFSCAYLAKNAKTGHVQKQLTETLDEVETPYVILKGESAAAYYTNPDFRVLGDVDFLVPESCLQKAGKALEDKGYTRFEEDHVCHVVYTRPGAVVEMHFALSGMPKGDKKQKTFDFLNDIFEKKTIKNIGGGEFCAPCDLHHAVVLLLHMQHHMTGEGLGLRHLCDWAYFVKATGKQSFWEESLIPFLKEIGLFVYAKTVTKMCSLYLGIECPKWAVSADEDTAKELFCEILEGGNFGRKDELRRGSEKMVANRGESEESGGKIHNLYENLKCSVREKHKIVKKAPILFPFLLVYRAARYGALMLKGEKASLYKSAVQADKRITLYEKLRIFEEE